MKKHKIPKDLGLKIGTPTEILWTQVKDNLKGQIKLATEQTLVNKELLLVAERKIKEEQRRAKV